MDEQRSSHIEVLRRQQESLRADIEAIGREGAPHPQLIPLVQHACELLDAMVSEQSALSRAYAWLHETAEHRAARIAIINRIGQLITSNLSLDQILQRAVEAIHEYQEYPIVGVLLVDPEDPATLVLRACTNGYHPGEIGRYRQSIQQGIVGTAACTQRRIILEDVPSTHHYLTPPGTSNICTEIAVPIIVSDRLLGVLHIGVEQCSEDEAAGLQIIADQLGVAIDKAYLFARTQQTLAETQLLYETNQRMSTAMTIDEVIQAYLEQVAARGRYVCTVMLYAFDEAGQRIASVIRGRWTPQEGLVHLEEHLPHTRDAFDALLDAGQTVTIDDFRTDPRVSAELRLIQRGNPRLAWAMIPLMVQDQRLGLVVLSYPYKHQWCDADLQPYQATAAQLAAAINSRQQHRLLIERGQRLAVLEERQRLARELHDSVTQLIFSMTLIAQSIGPAWRRDPPEGERRVNRIVELSQAALAEMRALLAELRPPEGSAMAADAAVASPSIELVRRAGLAAALRQLFADVARDGLQIHFDAHGYVRQPLEQEAALYRITQEALNNVVKHAQAQLVEIELVTTHSSTCLAVRDDGKGFAVESVGASDDRRHRRHRGFGLSTMQERASALGGATRIVSSPGRGTTVQVTLPRKDDRT